jgi:hypothetical protein
MNIIPPARTIKSVNVLTIGKTYMDGIGRIQLVCYENSGISSLVILSTGTIIPKVSIVITTYIEVKENKPLELEEHETRCVENIPTGYLVLFLGNVCILGRRDNPGNPEVEYAINLKSGLMQKVNGKTQVIILKQLEPVEFEVVVEK